MNREVKTKTKLGTFIVNVGMPVMVHVVRHDTLIQNQIVYSATIENFKGVRGHIKQGWTFAQTIDAEDFEMINEFALLINPKITRLYPVNGDGAPIN